MFLCRCVKLKNVHAQRAETWPVCEHAHIPIEHVRGLTPAGTHTLTHENTLSHAFKLQHSNSLFKSSDNFTSAWATPTRSRVLGSHVAEQCTAWLYVDEDNIPTHALSDARPPHWQDARSEESSMKDLPTNWGGLPQKLSGGRWLEAKRREGIPGRIPECLKCDFVFSEEI